MKVLITVMDTNLGGITSAATNFTNELANRGHNVDFLDLSGEFLSEQNLSPAVTKIELTGFQKYWNITANNSKGLQPLPHKLLGLIKKLTIKSGFWYNLIFKKLKTQEAYDVAMAFRQCEAGYLYVLKKVVAKQKIGFVHGELTFMGDISSWKKHMSKFDKIAYVSNAVREQFITKFPELSDNACTIYNMFDVQKINQMAKAPIDFIIDEQISNIVTVARIENEIKQIDWIVEACRRLKEINVKFHWYVVGDGPDLEMVKEFAKSQDVLDVLTFVGQTNNPYNIIEKCDFMVLSSKTEAYPMVVIEALVLKKPVVSTRFGSVDEMIVPEKHGIIAEQSIDDLFQCVFAMATNKDGIFDNCNNYLSKIEITNEKAYVQFMEGTGF